MEHDVYIAALQCIEYNLEFFEILLDEKARWLANCDYFDALSRAVLCEPVPDNRTKYNFIVSRHATKRFNFRPTLA